MRTLCVIFLCVLTIGFAKDDDHAVKGSEAESADGGHITTASGLKYRVLTAAEGKKPVVTSSVTVHYVGKLEDGKVFDSSRKRGQPATFPLKAVIKGWTEGLQLMSPGATYEFIIPSKLGYGKAGAGATIPPNATLIFEVELISFK